MDCALKEGKSEKTEEFINNKEIIIFETQNYSEFSKKEKNDLMKKNIDQNKISNAKNSRILINNEIKNI